MNEKKVVLICSLMISLSIIAGSLWIGNSIINANKNNNVNESSNSLLSNKALITEKQAAEYLNLSQSKFKDLVSYSELQRQGLNSYDTYRFIPFVQIDEDKYFNKQELDKWVQYNVMNRNQIDTKGM